ncbi:hypothetical protein F4780DRAFT_617233 [Xylariomycetidae sp. FL0641]|nr:hypothetical protein F4780DRAFT_617233 [Xylariomycetidae sp. FL0641]
MPQRIRRHVRADDNCGGSPSLLSGRMRAADFSSATLAEYSTATQPSFRTPITPRSALFTTSWPSGKQHFDILHYPYPGLGKPVGSSRFCIPTAISPSRIGARSNDVGTRWSNLRCRSSPPPHPRPNKSVRLGTAVQQDQDAYPAPQLPNIKAPVSLESPSAAAMPRSFHCHVPCSMPRTSHQGKTQPNRMLSAASLVILPWCLPRYPNGSNRPTTQRLICRVTLGVRRD